MHGWPSVTLSWQLSAIDKSVNHFTAVENMFAYMRIAGGSDQWF
jgi:hypothetical protein